MDSCIEQSAENIIPFNWKWEQFSLSNIDTAYMV